MSDTDGDAQAPAPAALAADVGYMDLNQALQDVQKTSLIHDGLCKGLKQATKAHDRRQAHLCVLANSVDEPSYVELIEAGYAEHGINLLKVDDDAKQLGEWAGLCKLVGEGKAGQVNACGVVDVKDPGMETPALEVARDYFKSNFLHDRMQRDGLEHAPGLDQMQEPDTPKGPPMEHVREIARALKCIGDDLDRDQKLQEQATKVPPEAERPTLLNVAANIFEDGIFTWGPVVALFYFAYKVCVKALDRIPLVRTIINLIVEFMRGRVLQWNLERGRREANREYFGSSGKRFALVIGAGVAACAGVLLYRNYLC